MRALGKPLWPNYYHLLVQYSDNLTKELLSKGKGSAYVAMYPYLRLIVFDLALSLTYGTQSTGVDDAFTDGLVASINRIPEFRASTQRMRDYVPLLRFLVPDFASRNAVAVAENERQEYLDMVYAGLKVDCIVNGLV
jgi:phenylacetate 2-hydroxylase